MSVIGKQCRQSQDITNVFFPTEIMKFTGKQYNKNKKTTDFLDKSCYVLAPELRYLVQVLDLKQFTLKTPQILLGDPYLKNKILEKYNNILAQLLNSF